MAANTKLTVYNDKAEVIGWIRNFGCDNSECTTHIVNGKRWHAIPAGFAVTLDTYHFLFLDRALDALHGAWRS